MRGLSCKCENLFCKKCEIEQLIRMFFHDQNPKYLFLIKAYYTQNNILLDIPSDINNYLFQMGNINQEEEEEVPELIKLLE
jgi:hypothetical protein